MIVVFGQTLKRVVLVQRCLNETDLKFSVTWMFECELGIANTASYFSKLHHGNYL